MTRCLCGTNDLDLEKANLVREIETSPDVFVAVPVCGLLCLLVQRWREQHKDTAQTSFNFDVV